MAATIQTNTQQGVAMVIDKKEIGIVDAVQLNFKIATGIEDAKNRNKILDDS